MEGQDAEALYEEGLLCLLGGKGRTVDLVKAFSFFEKAANLGHPLAQLRLGACYRNGKGTKKDTARAAELFAKAFEGVKKRAEEHPEDADAATCLAGCYFNSWGVAQDLQEGLNLLQKAADQGYAAAQFMLGVCYEIGAGVKKDLQKAAEWFARAADQGYVHAQLKIGEWFERGTVFVKSLENAVVAYEKAASQGYQPAIDALQRLKPRNAAATLDPPAPVFDWMNGAYKEGLLWLNGGEGRQIDFKKAVALFEEAAAAGNPLAKVRLGLFLKPRATKLLEEAFRELTERGKGDDEEALCLALCHIFGHVEGSNEEEGAKVAAALAEKGLPEAQYLLGICCRKLIWVEKSDKVEAELYKKAADQGFAPAQMRLGECYASGQGVAKDEKNAVDLVEKAADQGFAPAQFALGQWFEEGVAFGHWFEQGISFRQSLEQAIAWYEKAAAQEDQPAIEALERLRQRPGSAAAPASALVDADPPAVAPADAPGPAPPDPAPALHDILAWSIEFRLVNGLEGQRNTVWNGADGERPTQAEEILEWLRGEGGMVAPRIEGALPEGAHVKVFVEEMCEHPKQAKRLLEQGLPREEVLWLLGKFLEGKNIAREGLTLESLQRDVEEFLTCVHPDSDEARELRRAQELFQLFSK